MDGLIYKCYLFDVSDLYGKYCIVNLDYLKEIENELISQGKYLPVLVRRHLSNDYLNYLKQNNVLDNKLFEQLTNSRNFTYEEEISEFKEWLNHNSQYANLFNSRTYDNLQNELRKVKKEYEDLKLW